MNELAKLTMEKNKKGIRRGVREVWGNGFCSVSLVLERSPTPQVAGTVHLSIFSFIYHTHLVAAVNLNRVLS